MTRHLHDAEQGAAAWDARLRGAKAGSSDRQAFQAWLHEDVEHQIAYDRLQVALAALRANASLPELRALRDEACDTIGKRDRRRWALAMSAAAAAVLLLVAIVALRLDRHPEAVAPERGGETLYATSPTERTKVTLADGSVVTLDAGTRLSARLGPSRREVALVSGRALFHVAKDRQRPFVVTAGDRTVTALGTVFDVNLAPDKLAVTLAEGSVAVRPVRPSRGAVQQVLKPRQQLVHFAGSPVVELRTVDTDEALSWAEGQVFFDNEPLASAAAQMNRYSPIKILVDPAVADLRISGMFHTSNQAGFLDALATALPVQARSDMHGAVRLSRRPDPHSHGEKTRAP